MAARWRWGSSFVACGTLLGHPRGRETTTPGVLGEGRRGLLVGTRGRVFRVCVSGVGGRGRGRCESGKMAAAAVVEFQRAQSLLSTDREASIDILHSIVKHDNQENDEEAVQVKEQSILELGSLLAKTGQADELGGLLKYVRPFLNSISKLKQLVWSGLFLICF